MVKVNKKLAFQFIVFFILASLPVFAQNSSVMFVANDPQEMVFTNLQTLIEFTQTKLLGNNTVSQRDLVNFWETIRNHGAPNAGQAGGAVRVALVVSPDSPSTHGILVLQGSFDKKAVIELIARRYSEHIDGHVSDSRQQELGIGSPDRKILGYPAHSFILPVRNRVLHIVDLGQTLLFSSHKQGDLGLLQRTIRVLTGKTPLKALSSRSSHVKFAFEPTPQEQKLLLEQIDDTYERYCTGRMAHRRGVKRFSETLRKVVVDKKVKRVKSYVAEMQKAVFLVERLISSIANSKVLTLTLSFQSQETAQAVKSAIVQHLVAEMKKTANSEFRLALKNPNVSVNGTSVLLRVPLETERDQLHAFSIMATFVARSIINTRQPPVVRRLKFIADQEARLGRKLDGSIHAEMARTSFFSFGRKFSLMFSGMKVRSNIRRSEDVYVDLSKDPEVLHSSAQKLVDISNSNLDQIYKLIDSNRKAFSNNANTSPSLRQELAALRVMKLELVGSARLLVSTVRASGYKSLAGPLPKKLEESIFQLAQKTGIPNVLATGAKAALSPDEPLDSNISSVESSEFQSNVSIPEGLTLEQAYNQYQAALKAYTDAVVSNNESKMQEMYDVYISKFQIYQALMEKREESK